MTRPAPSPSLAIAAVSALLLIASAGCSSSSAVKIEPLATSSATAQPPPVQPAPTVEPITHLLFTGDLIPARCTYAKIRDLGGDFRLPFQPLHDLLSAADITIGSLDATASDAGTPFDCVETFSLAAPAAAVTGFQYAGYDVISHAANHIKDCGVSPCGDRAMLETDANLRAAGVAAVGSGRNLSEARAPVVVQRNGVYFAFLAYDDIADVYHATDDAPGSAPLDAETIAADVAAARQVANVVVIVPHWGIEYTASPSERQRGFARAAAAGGADLVVGNHPHWVQAHERIGNTFIAYALGNFVFDQDWSLETQQGALLDIAFTGTRITATRYIPVHIYDQYQPRLAERPEADQILERIETASAELRTP